MIINNERFKTNRNNDDLVNEDIRFPNVLVIGPEGEQLGVMPRLRALQVAETYSLDLLCVAKDAKVPVCKIINYGKYRFESQKRAKEARKNQKQKEIEIKEVQLTPQIGQHDLETKVKHALRFLNEGNKVRVALRFKGRQLSHVEVGEEVMNRFISLVQDVAVIEKQPLLDKKLLVAILASKVKK